MSEKPKHTPLPWKIEGIYFESVDISAKGKFNAGFIISRTFGPDRKANAKFIVRACNSYYTLLSHLKTARDLIKKNSMSGDTTWDFSKTLDSIIDEEEGIKQ